MCLQYIALLTTLHCFKAALLKKEVEKRVQTERILILIKAMFMEFAETNIISRLPLNKPTWHGGKEPKL